MCCVRCRIGAREATCRHTHLRTRRPNADRCRPTAAAATPFVARATVVSGSQRHCRENGASMARRTGPGQGAAPEEPDQTRFERFAHRVSEATGHPTAFALAMLVVVAWAVTGPLFHFDSGWQLVINTGTTIVTFLMVFLIQCMQNRDTAALQLKLDELLWAISAADNDMIEVEHKGERTIEHLRQNLRELAARESADKPVHQ